MTTRLWVNRTLGLLAMAATMLWLAAGCATKPAQPRKYAFFPKPPDEPRVQYLTGFSSERELSPGFSFKEFVLGTDKYHRPIGKPYGVAVGKGKIYLADTGAKALETIDLEKATLRYLKVTGEGALVAPINVAVDAEGNRYVTDTALGKVMIYAATGEFVGALGNRQETRPAGIAVAGNRLYVTDLQQHNVRVYDLASRKVLLTIPRDPKEEKSVLRSPTNVAVDQQGRIYVSDTGSYCAQVYDAEGNYLRTLGEQGLSAGRFAMPKGIAVDRQGITYIVDAATQVVQMFDADGRALMYFGDPTSPGDGHTDLPAGIAVDYENVGFYQKYAARGFKVEHLIFLINQFGPLKVTVYGFGRKN